jgi:uncharacterized protein (TIGR01244 family)
MNVFGKVFLAAIAVSFIAVLGIYLVNLWLDKPKESLVFTPLKDNIYVTSQISAQDISQIKQQNFLTIIDIRPDGEADNQISSDGMQAVSKAANIEFYYLPVQKSVLPIQQAEKLAKIIEQSSSDVLLYCRSGNRATRTYALALAMTVNGPSLNDINAMVNKAGFSVQDIQVELKAQIAKRGENV